MWRLWDVKPCTHIFRAVATKGRTLRNRFLLMHILSFRTGPPKDCCFPTARHCINDTFQCIALSTYRRFLSTSSLTNESLRSLNRERIHLFILRWIEFLVLVFHKTHRGINLDDKTLHNNCKLHSVSTQMHRISGIDRIFYKLFMTSYLLIETS